MPTMASVAPPHRTETLPDGSGTEYFEVVPEEDRLRDLLTALFSEHWEAIVFGPVIQGAVFEARFFERPQVSYLDGYLTVGVPGPRGWHLHLCIGPHAGTATRPTPPALAAWRRCARAAFYRDRDPHGTQASWGFRMWNGREEQMLTVFFPNPWIEPERQAYASEPDWSRLDLWMRLRERHAGIPAEPPPPGSPPPRTH
jgi:hypothetical protein